MNNHNEQINRLSTIISHITEALLNISCLPLDIPTDENVMDVSTLRGS